MDLFDCKLDAYCWFFAVVHGGSVFYYLRKMNVQNMAHGLNQLISLYLSALGDSLDDYFEINTAFDDYNFVTKSGYVCTLLKVRGCLEEDDNYDSYRSRCDVLAENLAHYFNSEQHIIQVNYRRSNSGSDKIWSDSVKTAVDRANVLELNLGDLFESQSDAFVEKIVNEDVVVALWSKTNNLSPKKSGEELEEVVESEKKLGGTLQKSKQALVGGFSQVMVAHKEFVRDFIKSLDGMGTACQTLKRDAAVNAIGKVLSPEIIDELDIIFPDSAYNPKRKENVVDGVFSIEDALWPSLSEQILPEDSVECSLSEKVSRVGRTLFSSFEVSEPPRNLVTFNALADYIDKDVPTLISFYMDSAVSFEFFWKKTLSKFPYPSSNDRLNKSIKATDSLKLIKKPTAEYKISVCTWGTDIEVVSENNLHLKSAFSKWGGARCREYRGNPVKALMNSVAGVNSKSFGGTAYAPLNGIVPQLPLSRRLSLWTSSFLSFMAEGGKLFPFAPTSSSFQRYWNIAVLADMGSGKSVLIQNMAWAHWLASNPRGLVPRIGYLDVGFSSRETIRTLKALSNKDKRHRYLHHTLQNNESNACNVHDTELGCRLPDEDHRKFILNFYLAILTPEGENSPHPDIPALLAQAINDAYRYLRDGEHPKEYQEGLNKDVDAKLQEWGIDANMVPWWEIVDMLFDRKELVLAAKAQRYAVPTIKDVIEQLNISKTIKNSFSSVTVGNGANPELLKDHAARLLMHAMDTFPIIAKPTRLDVEGANFMILDLNNVAKGETPREKKQAGIFYLLGRFIVTRGFYITEELMDVVPEKYKEYHAKRIPLIKAQPKLVIYDEFHRAGHLSSIVAQLLGEMREGRKWNLSIILATQLLGDISKEMLHLLSTIILMSNSVGTEKDVVDKFRNFGLNGHLLKFFRNKCTGPDGARGTPILSFIKVKKKYLAQSFRFVISPYLYWVTTSDAADADFKEYVVTRLGALKGISVLSEVYPYGVKGIVENLTENHEDQSVRDNPFEFIYKELSSKMAERGMV